MDLDAAGAPGSEVERQADIDAVRRYAEAYPHAWRGFRLEPDRVIAVFADADSHWLPISELVSDPDRMVVETARRSEAEIESILADIQLRLESARGTWSSFGSRIDVVRVNFLGKGEPVARELHERYGDAVVLSVGGSAYPFADPPPLVTFRRAPRSTLDHPTIRARAMPDSQTVMSGEDLTGHLLITNLDPDDQLVLDTGQPLDGYLLRNDLIIGASFANKVGTGRTVMLDPGASTQIAFSAGTDSRDPQHGPLLPPGTYELVVVVPVYEIARVPQHDQQLVTWPEPITVTLRE